MATRRQFLATTFAAAQLPLASGLAQAVSALNVRLITDCSSDFARYLGECTAGSAEFVSSDPAALLFELTDSLQRGAIDAVLGLSLPSIQFLFEQSAGRHGFGLVFSGRHQLGEYLTTHELRSRGDLNDVLSRSLAQEPRRWLPHLGNAMLEASRSDRRVSNWSELSRTSKASLATESPTNLVSWVLAR